MLLKDKTAVISGSNRGIGKSIVEIFSKNGANISYNRLSMKHASKHRAKQTNLQFAANQSMRVQSGLITEAIQAHLR